MPSGTTARAPSTARLPIAVITSRPLIVTALARATLRLSSRPECAMRAPQRGPVAGVPGDHGAAAAAGDPGDEDLAGRMADAERAHRMDRFDEQRVAFGEDGERRAAGGRPGAALDQRVGAARAHLRREGRPGVGGDVPRRHRLDARGAPERLLGDVDAGAVVGGQEDEARRVGRGLGRAGARATSMPLCAGGGRPAADLRRRRPDEDELARRDRAAVVHQPLLLERVLGGRRVGEGGVDLAVARRLEHRQGRPGNEQHGDAGVGAEGVLEAARQARFGEGAVDAEAQRAAPLGRLLRARAAGEAVVARAAATKRRRLGIRALLRPATAVPWSRGSPGPPVDTGSTPGLHWRHPQSKRAAAP